MALAAQQQRIIDLPHLPFLGIASDGAVNRARMLLDQLHELEKTSPV